MFLFFFIFSTACFISIPTKICMFSYENCPFFLTKYRLGVNSLDQVWTNPCEKGTLLISYGSVFFWAVTDQLLIRPDQNLFAREAVLRVRTARWTITKFSVIGRLGVLRNIFCPGLKCPCDIHDELSIYSKYINGHPCVYAISMNHGCIQ